MTDKRQPDSFPPELLKASAGERVAYFKSRMIDHTMLNTAHKRSMDALTMASRPQLVVITGPTGVGKTTLARRIYRDLVEAHAKEVAADASIIPVLGINAVPPNGSAFSWKDFYYRLLEQNGEVLIDRKLNMPRQGTMFPELLYPPAEASTVDSLRRALEKCIRKRKTQYVIVDEAHHLLMVKDYARMEYQFETLKSLSNEGNTTIVLAGNYRLMDIRDHSGQLVRRSEIIHFPRYDLRKKVDADSFASVLNTLQYKMPLPQRPDLLGDVQYFYAKTGGCMGILKDWLTRCLEQAVKEKRRTIDVDFAERYALDNKGLRTIIEEALAGEAKLEDEPLDAIKSLLKDGYAKSSSPVKPQPAPSKRGPVGVRKPQRDPVGRHHATG